MTATIIDGQAVANRYREKLAGEIDRLKKNHGVTPALATVLVGENPASKVYVSMKEKDSLSLGIKPEVHRLPVDFGQEALLELVEELNRREEIHGLLVQFPLPEGYDQTAVIEAIDPAKDVDGLHPLNMGRLMGSSPRGPMAPFFTPCTPAGVMALIKEANFDPAGKETVVLGRSILVGKPVALLLLAANATVTICHSWTRDLAAKTKEAHLLVAAVGRPRLVTGDMIRPGAVVIDVGTNRLPDGSLCGDVDFESAKEVAQAITPVPKGVGPMTRAMLMANTVRAALRTVGEDLKI